MPNTPVGKKEPESRVAPKDPREREVFERTRILNSMRKWRQMDEPARLLGRGLGKKALIDRVAMEVGVSLRRIHSALKTS